jgi:chromosome segregation ATPase
MRTLQEHIDDLDRMIDSSSAPKHEVRSQIAFIGKQVAAIEADYACLADAHTKLQEAHSILEIQHTGLKKAQHDVNFDALKKEADEQQKIIQSEMLNHNV